MQLARIARRREAVEMDEKELASAEMRLRTAKGKLEDKHH